MSTTMDSGVPLSSEPFLWIVVLAGIVSFFDAFSIGANDVANSWATSVASRSITLKMAVMIACFTEFVGALLLGARVADTIRKGIIDVEMFYDSPYVLMVVMLCANVGSCTWVGIATYWGLPVSTTHSVVGGVMGAGIAAYPTCVKWGWGGFGKIAASWFISPVLAGVIGATIFLIIKFSVLTSSSPYSRSKIVVPFFYFLSFCIITFFIFYKGSPAIKKLDLSLPVVVGISIGVATVACMIGTVITFKVVAPHIESTPDLNAVYGTSKSSSHSKIPTDEEEAKDLENGVKKPATPPATTEVAANYEVPEEKEVEDASAVVTKEPIEDIEKGATVDAAADDAKPEKKKGLLWLALNEDVVSAKTETAKMVHESSEKYDGQTERMFSSLQIITASFASFAHGANDLANALAPFAVVVFIYENGYVPEEKKFDIPFWQILYCAIGLDLGLLLFGRKLMGALGNQLCLNSPSRGFCMELGAMTTVLIASKVGIPVSTTHCITGATTGVALCNAGSSSGKTFNWKKGAIIFFGWILTVPMAGVVAGSLCGLMLYSPSKATDAASSV